MTRTGIGLGPRVAWHAAERQGFVGGSRLALGGSPLDRPRELRGGEIAPQPPRHTGAGRRLVAVDCWRDRRWLLRGYRAAGCGRDTLATPTKGLAMAHETAEAERLTIYLTETDRRGSRPMAEWLIDLAREQGMAGATAFRGWVGFGRRRRIHAQHLLSIVNELPVIVQVVDEADRIERFLAAAGGALDRYTYLREPVLWHRPAGRDGASPSGGDGG